MKKILYTICSANHLAYCKTMIDSFVKFNKGYNVIIVLVDRLFDQYLVDQFLPHTIIQISEMNIEGFEDMSKNYSVLELVCAMKVFAGKNILSEYNPDLLIYLDTDIIVMHDFQVVEEALQEKDILITPHATTTFPDNDFLPRERDFNRSGIYNAGFLALKNTKNTLHFLDWWASHMQTECYLDFAEGMGADQVWMNLIPILFEKVSVFLHPGANVAYWNLHERELSIVENKVYVNESWPLLFLHISGYDFSKPLNLSRHQNRFNLIDMPLLKSLLDQYRELVVKNGYETFSKYKCAYGRKKKKKIGLMRTLNKWLKPFKISITKI